ncbi:MAG: hypothetical protein LBG99_08480 [Propionibacteriaceae bacterium]|jgi:hypothetical protein|nr:hypothetical protein [Propionibacteriaceae bacterium]
MELEVAQWLVSSEARPYIDQAASYSDPSSLSAGTSLRRELSPDRAAAVLDLVSLRRRAHKKLGDMADHLFLTQDSLEQATRWEVALWRARHLAALGITRVTDAGCGVGIDSVAFHTMGISVTALERDSVLATLASANLALGTTFHDPKLTEPSNPQETPDPGSSGLHEGPTSPSGDISTSLVPGNAPTPWEVHVTDLTAHTDWLPRDQDHALYLDPARRNAHRRSWDIRDLSPSWEFVESMINRRTSPVIIKLAPGFPRRLLPENTDVTWVSHRGDLVETTLWAIPQARSRREAVIVDGATEHRLPTGDDAPAPGPVGTYVYEPDPAVIRARAIPTLASFTSTHPIADHIAYLTGNDLHQTRFASVFAVEEIQVFSPKALKAWVASRDIGTLEIKVRGLDIDPASFRRTLKLTGRNQATVILTPSPEGAKALIVRRI